MRQFMWEIIRAFIDAHEAGLGIIILAVMLVGFITERFPPTVVAILGTAFMLSLGMLDEKGLFSVFSNQAPITIGAMFILSGALLRTGTMDAVASYIIDRARKRPKLAVVEMMVGVYFASAFMNNTPVVIVMIPIIIRLSQAVGISAKKLLIPLSYICILGGTTTLMGTSTNLLVDGVAREAGMDGFSVFSITPYGLVAGIVGALALALFSRYLLPDDDTSNLSTLSEEKSGFLTELRLLPGSELIGKRMGDIPIAKRANAKVLAMKRDGRFMRTAIFDKLLEPNDQLVVTLSLAELLSLRASLDFEIGMTGEGREHVLPSQGDIVEATISPSHTSIGNRLNTIPFIRNLDVRILGISRFRKLPAPDLGGARIQAVDRLLVSGPADQIAQMHNNPNLYGVGETKERAFRREKAPIAIGALAAVVIFSALDIMSIGMAAIIAVGAILVTRCIDAEEAWQSVDGNVLVLIFAMLAVGTGLEQTGSVQMVVSALTPILSAVPPWGLVVAVYALSVMLTEVVTNNAVAIIVTPIVIKLAQDLGVSPEPLVIAVMFAASASFATPIGYQTNTLVYAAGGYRFTDFFKAGIPLTLAVGLATCIAISFAY